MPDLAAEFAHRPSARRAGSLLRPMPRRARAVRLLPGATCHLILGRRRADGAREVALWQADVLVRDGEGGWAVSPHAAQWVFPGGALAGDQVSAAREVLSRHVVARTGLRLAPGAMRVLMRDPSVHVCFVEVPEGLLPAELIVSDAARGCQGGLRAMRWCALDEAASWLGYREGVEQEPWCARQLARAREANLSPLAIRAHMRAPTVWFSEALDALDVAWPAQASSSSAPAV